MPASIDNIEQLDGAKLLGVILQENHKMDSHIQYILSQCAQPMYLLKLLKHQGMPIEKLSVNCCTFFDCVSDFVCSSSMGRFSVC